MSTPKTFKRILALLLSLVLIAGMLPLSAAADGDWVQFYSDQALSTLLDGETHYVPGESFTVYMAMDSTEYTNNAVQDLALEAGTWVGTGEPVWTPLQDQSVVTLGAEEAGTGVKIFPITVSGSITGDLAIRAKWNNGPGDTDGQWRELGLFAYYQGLIFHYTEYVDSVGAVVIPDQVPQCGDPDYNDWYMQSILPEHGLEITGYGFSVTAHYLDEAAGTVSAALPIGTLTKTGNVDVRKFEVVDPNQFKHSNGSPVTVEENILMSIGTTSAADFGEAYSVTLTLARAVSGVPNTLTFNGTISDYRGNIAFWTDLSYSRSAALEHFYRYTPGAATGENKFYYIIPAERANSISAENVEMFLSEGNDDNDLPLLNPTFPGTFTKLTVPNDDRGIYEVVLNDDITDSFSLCVRWKFDGDDRYRLEYIQCRPSYTGITLRNVYINYDEETHTEYFSRPRVDEFSLMSSGFVDGAEFRIDNNYYLAAYYVTETAAGTTVTGPIPVDELTLAAAGDVETVKVEDYLQDENVYEPAILKQEDEGYFFVLRFGEDPSDFTVTWDDNNSVFHGAAAPPSVGFYTSAQPSISTLIREYMYGPGEHTVYFVVDKQKAHFATVSNVRFSSNGEPAGHYWALGFQTGVTNTGDTPETAQFTEITGSVVDNRYAVYPITFDTTGIDNDDDEFWDLTINLSYDSTFDGGGSWQGTIEQLHVYPNRYPGQPIAGFRFEDGDYILRKEWDGEDTFWVKCLPGTSGEELVESLPEGLTYAPATKTLTMNRYSGGPIGIMGSQFPGYAEDEIGFGYCVAIPDVNIAVTGSNTITSVNECGLFIENANVTIGGTGRLDIIAGYDTQQLEQDEEGNWIVLADGIAVISDPTTVLNITDSVNINISLGTEPQQSGISSSTWCDPNGPGPEQSDVELRIEEHAQLHITSPYSLGIVNVKNVSVLDNGLLETNAVNGTEFGTLLITDSAEVRLTMPADKTKKQPWWSTVNGFRKVVLSESCNVLITDSNPATELDDMGNLFVPYTINVEEPMGWADMFTEDPSGLYISDSATLRIVDNHGIHVARGAFEMTGGELNAGSGSGIGLFLDWNPDDPLVPSVVSGGILTLTQGSREFVSNDLPPMENIGICTLVPLTISGGVVTAEGSNAAGSNYGMVVTSGHPNGWGKGSLTISGDSTCYFTGGFGGTEGTEAIGLASWNGARVEISAAVSLTGSTMALDSHIASGTTSPLTLTGVSLVEVPTNTLLEQKVETRPDGKHFYCYHENGSEEPYAVEIAIKKTPDLGTVYVSSATPKLYKGDLYSDVVLERSNNTLAGTLSLDQQELTVGTKAYTWTFIPSNVLYAPAVGTVNITVYENALVPVEAFVLSNTNTLLPEEVAVALDGNTLVLTGSISEGSHVAMKCYYAKDSTPFEQWQLTLWDPAAGAIQAVEPFTIPNGPQYTVDISGLQVIPAKVVVAAPAAPEITSENVTITGTDAEQTAATNILDDLKDETKGLANTTATGLVAATADNAVDSNGVSVDDSSNSTVTTAAAVEMAKEDTAFETVLGAVGEENLVVVVEPFLDIQVTDVSVEGSKQSFTLDITPYYNVLVTDATTAANGDVQKETDATAGTTQNAVQINEEPIPMTVSSPVTLSVPVPTSFADEVNAVGSTKNIYVKHEKIVNGVKRVYYYPAEYDSDTQAVTFVNPHGFSSFTFEIDSRSGSVTFVDLGITENYTLANVGDALPTVEAPEGYTFVGWTIGKAEKCTELTDELLTAIDAAAVIVAEALFEEKPTASNPGSGGGAEEPEEWSCDGKENCPSHPFSDVNTAKWYHEAVDYVITNGIMSGVGSGKFQPNGTLTRSMFCQILYNIEGKPAVTAENTFTDVKDTWYTSAVIWAYENKIVAGYGNGKFGPNDPITREQLAIMLCNYAAYKGEDTTPSSAALTFVDAARVHSWANKYVRWAVEKGVLSGKDGNKLDPQGKAQRCEVASVIMRYLKSTAAEAAE